MKFRDILQEVQSTLLANRMRSILTILGIVIGIAAVITMSSLVSGMGESLSKGFGLQQSKVVTIMAGSDASEASYEALAKAMPQIYSSILIVDNSVSSSFSVEGNSKTITANYIIGSSDEYAEATGLQCLSGSYFTAQDNASAHKVVVLGDGIVKDLYGSKNAQVVGEKISILGDSYTIVGVADSSKSGGTLMTDTGTTIYMPFSTKRIRLNSEGSIIGLGMLKDDPITLDLDQIGKDTQQTFGSILGISDWKDAINVVSAASMVNELNSLVTAIALLMTTIASISLLVGGIGIMNMMLTNVTERIHEIGLRKSLGARSRDITVQFLFESIILTILGGLIGVIFGYLASGAMVALINVLMNGFDLPLSVDPGLVLIATAVSAAIGLIFGYYPARRAAKMDPVEALRYE
ncbi:MAG: ABC transporter permease [Eggerthellaceae bacterium]|jgi:putative ABC transport system permease protein|nr:ABC transporter permease [Eggerthellaceae bacterium]